MTKAPPHTIDLARLSLGYGEGARLEVPIRVDPLDLGGQTYAATPSEAIARLDVSRPSGGHAFRLRFPLRVEGPCMRCLEPAAVEVEVDAREVDQSDTDDEELLSPYVVDYVLDAGRWAGDAAILALPQTILCRPDCAGLCPTCGEPLNDAEPGEHDHEKPTDPRWAALDQLKQD